MAENEYEEQPEAPDLGASAQLESSESLVGPANEDALDAGYIPPDRPFGLDDGEVTSAAMREPEALDDRLRRERPDIGAEDDPEPGQGPGPDGVAGDDRSGRIAPAVDTAVEGTATDDGDARDALDAVDVGISGGAASAEEAAVHEMEDGSPVDDEDYADRDDGSRLA